MLSLRVLTLCDNLSSRVSLIELAFVFLVNVTLHINIPYTRMSHARMYTVFIPITKTDSLVPRPSN